VSRRPGSVLAIAHGPARRHKALAVGDHFCQSESGRDGSLVVEFAAAQRFRAASAGAVEQSPCGPLCMAPPLVRHHSRRISWLNDRQHALCQRLP